APPAARGVAPRSVCRAGTVAGLAGPRLSAGVGRMRVVAGQRVTAVGVVVRLGAQPRRLLDLVAAAVQVDPALRPVDVVDDARWEHGLLAEQLAGRRYQVAVAGVEASAGHLADPPVDGLQPVAGEPGAAELHRRLGP